MHEFYLYLYLFSVFSPIAPPHPYATEDACYAEGWRVIDKIKETHRDLVAVPVCVDNPSYYRS
jgi:hypothetical protein